MLIKTFYFCFAKFLFQCTTDVESSSVISTVTTMSGGKDSADQELFDFLNETSPAVNGSQKSNGRPSSSASSRSQKTPELPASVADGSMDGDHIGAEAFFVSQHYTIFVHC